jgi:hypothetical protein
MRSSTSANSHLPLRTPNPVSSPPGFTTTLTGLLQMTAQLPASLAKHAAGSQCYTHLPLSALYISAQSSSHLLFVVFLVTRPGSLHTCTTAPDNFASMLCFVPVSSSVDIKCKVTPRSYIQNIAIVLSSFNSVKGEHWKRSRGISTRVRRRGSESSFSGEINLLRSAFWGKYRYSPLSLGLCYVGRA